MESICTISLLEAVKNGYEVDEKGNVFYKGRKHNLSTNIKTGYFYFSRRILINGKSVSKQVFVHRLVAYFKFGDEIFKKGIHVRHRNGNQKDNSEDNILIGTISQNNMDKLPELRLSMSLHACSFRKKHNHEDIIKMHNEGLSYNKIMQKTGIKSKGTINYIIDKSFQSKNTVL